LAAGLRPARRRIRDAPGIRASADPSRVFPWRAQHAPTWAPSVRRHTLTGACEHAFGEDRRRAGPPRAEHLRVGASPAPLSVSAEAARAGLAPSRVIGCADSTPAAVAGTDVAGRLMLQSSNEDSTPLLTYFDIRGRAEVIRLILEEAAAPY